MHRVLDATMFGMSTDKRGVTAKKSLGQNFLKDSKTIQAVIDTAVLGTTVLEVGPGKGALTKKLLQAGHQVIAVEKDDRLIEVLEDMFTDEISSQQLQIVHGDALETKPEMLGLVDGQYQIVTNLPYYITGIFLRTTLEHSVRPTSITLLLQREVIDRIVSRDGKGSLLATSVTAFGTVKKICNVPRKYFSPIPAVDSAVLYISDISDRQFTDAGVSIDQFFTVVRAGFANKRKMLKNNLSTLLQDTDLSFAELVTQLGVSEKVRAENLTTEQWFVVTKIIAS